MTLGIWSIVNKVIYSFFFLLNLFFFRWCLLLRFPFKFSHLLYYWLRLHLVIVHLMEAAILKQDISHLLTGFLSPLYSFLQFRFLNHGYQRACIIIIMINMTWQYIMERNFVLLQRIFFVFSLGRRGLLFVNGQRQKQVFFLVLTSLQSHAVNVVYARIERFQILIHRKVSLHQSFPLLLNFTAFKNWICSFLIIYLLNRLRVIHLLVRELLLPHIFNLISLIRVHRLFVQRNGNTAWLLKVSKLRLFNSYPFEAAISSRRVPIDVLLITVDVMVFGHLLNLYYVTVLFILDFVQVYDKVLLILV